VPFLFSFYLLTILFFAYAESCFFNLVICVLQDLWRSRCSLKDVEGFDHSVVNDTLGACSDLPGEQHGPCLPYYIWQCGYTKVKSMPNCKCSIDAIRWMATKNLSYRLTEIK
jgi:hypothetical protein